MCPSRDPLRLDPQEAEAERRGYRAMNTGSGRSCGSTTSRPVSTGVYEWQGGELARRYAACMVALLAPFSNAGTARYQVVQGLRRDEYLLRPEIAPAQAEGDWWRSDSPSEPQTSSNRRVPSIPPTPRMVPSAQAAAAAPVGVESS